VVSSDESLLLHDVDHGDVALSGPESPPDPARFRHASDVARFVAWLGRLSTDLRTGQAGSPTIRRLLAWLDAHPTGSLTAHHWERAVMNWSDVDTHPNSSSMVSSDAS
jgi:hypothetical protein